MDSDIWPADGDWSGNRWRVGPRGATAIRDVVGQHFVATDHRAAISLDPRVHLVENCSFAWRCGADLV